MTTWLRASVLFLVCLSSLPAVAQEALTVVSSGPAGEISSLAQANEIRIRFSEPMVPIGRIADQVTAPFFSVRPAIAGTFRWAGPTILVFTPDPGAKLPNATTYQITIAASATAVSGRRLAQPYSFTFTTPTVRLLRTEWYREGGRYDRPLKIVLRFNQWVRVADVLAHASLRYEPHDWDVPTLNAEQRARMGTAAVAAFERKVADTNLIARSTAPVPIVGAADWDRKRYPADPAMVVLETTGAPSPGGFLALTLDRGLPGFEGTATPQAQQSFTIRLEGALFAHNFYCRRQCDAEAYNSSHLTVRTRLADLRRAAAIRDITDRSRELVVAPSVDAPSRRVIGDEIAWFNIEDLGYTRQPPSRTYAVTIDAGLQALDGQTLGYTFVDVVENWHMRAFTSFGDGHGVWEKSGGPVLPFYARNLTRVTQWAMPLGLEQLMPTVRVLQDQQFRASPPTAGVSRALAVTPDTIQSHGLDMSRALPSGTGLLWAAVQRGAPIAQARSYDEQNATRAAIVQVTNLGITVKDSPANTLIFVTSLDTATPVPDADVSIIGLDNEVRWRGRTDSRGVALAPQTRLRDARRWYEFAFIVTASKDGDTAYVANDWDEGIEPYTFGTGIDLFEADPLLRGTVFTDRSVYRPGEEIHVKAVVRADAPTGIDLFKSGTALHIAVRDSRDQTIDRRTVTVNEWSTTEWTMRLPSGGALGNYQIIASTDQSALDADRERREFDDPAPPYWKRQIRGSFLVEAYRRPDFGVDAALTADVPIAGEALHGSVSARYLFGAAMAKRPVRWTLTRTPMYRAPAAISDRYPFSQFEFVGCCDDSARLETEELAARTTEIDANGRLGVELETRPANGFPYQYGFEADLEDVSRQHIANRSTLVVHPAAFYIGLQRPPFFVDQKNGLKTAVVAASPTGAAVPGVTVDVTLVQLQWHSVRRAEGSGFYGWETERKEVEVGKYSVTTAAAPAPLDVPIPAGGYFLVKAVARDEEGRLAATRMSFYAIGSGYTAWERYDHNRIDLVPEQQSYKPGDTARLMIKSPWEQATALLTVEREGIRSYTPFTLTSTQQTVEVPITEKDIPNLYVSVVLVKGRTLADNNDEDVSDPGKPSVRMGYATLSVEDASKRLAVAVKANREEFKPAGSAKVEVDVKDAGGKPVASEVTLWAVDYGVLSLTAFRTPDVLGSIYMRKALQVLNSDNRERIISRRVLTPKGAGEGGGGGQGDASASELRKDFRVLAFWLGSVTTDRRGHASVTVKLPESLTTYRIMAVSGDKASRFGSGESEIRINKPVVLLPAFPRFLTRGDKAMFGSVVTSQLKTPGAAVVTIKSLDPAVLDVVGDARRVVQVPAGGSVEVRFDAAARGVGRARVQMSVQLQGQGDGFEDAIPVEVQAPPETVAAYGEAAPDSKQTVAMPTGVIPGFGGLHMELASTALVGLSEGARYVVEYPYGCVEQRASRAFVLLLAADLGDAFQLPGIDPKDLRSRVQSALRELESFQCASGGFAFWPGACHSVSPYLTSYVLHVYQQAAALNYDVSAEVMTKAYNYLEREMGVKPPVNESWWPAYTAWQAFAVKVLAEGGKNQDSNINRLYGYLDRMPIFGMTWLHDAMAAGRPSDARLPELRRRIRNTMLPEAGSVHVEELNDPYLLYFWNSNVRTTSIVLNSLVKAADGQADVTGMVRWLMRARKNGRWGNTQENAWAMQALVNYYRKYESRVPDFTATIRLGTQELVRESFKGRSTTAVVRDVPMARLRTVGAPGSSADLTFTREGEGTLFYAARLTYVRDAETFDSMNNGFHIERKYAVLKDGRAAAPAGSFAAGDLVQVTLSLDLPKERRFVAVRDPLPAGFEAVESWFATTAAQVLQTDPDLREEDWFASWQRGTFDHVERHDDRVQLFATRLAEGHHEFSYVVRATTAGVFQIGPATVEEMYEPEVSGRTATASVEVKP
jgi:alpha-2-macroglobulin